MQVTETILRNLNPELRQSITPPGIKQPYVLRIPVGAPDFVGAQANFRVVTVADGDKDLSRFETFSISKSWRLLVPSML